MEKLTLKELKDINGGSNDELWEKGSEMAMRMSTHYVASEMFGTQPK